MSQRTPERTGRSSRISTPRSRRNSKTPVRTPSRRRATIVSASLVTPRRVRKQSSTPQNTLRVLSRALVRERSEQDNGEQQALQTITAEIPSESNDQQSGLFNDFNDDFDTNIYEDTEKVLRSEIDHSNQALSIDNTLILSDIAVPAGIMPDIDASLYLDDSEDSPTKNQNGDVSRTPAQIISPQKDETLAKATGGKDKKVVAPTHPSKLLRTSAFKKYVHVCITKSLNGSALDTLAETVDTFLNQISDDLSAYCDHSKSKNTININSVYLLLRRQKLVTSVDSLIDVVENTAPLEDILTVRRNLKKLTRK